MGEPLSEQAPTSTVVVEDATHVRTFLIAGRPGLYSLYRGARVEAAAQLALRFAELTKEVVSGREGQVIELRGDEALAVLTSARQVLRASIDLKAGFLLRPATRSPI